ncbi:MAG: Hydroxymethylglutaryl-CoA reductase, partial [Solirubrobacterales bacterium]|nr:Hydroxymethylglutaryl-CoA reductase [Solirubrobacterales bacterium]
MTLSDRSARVPVPRVKDADYTREAADLRRAFATEQSGADLGHVGSYSFDPAVLSGYVEHFMGVAQVRIGLA